jgi:hypothetical protein
VSFGTKSNGRYLYYIPKPDLERHNLLADYTATMDHLFDTYVQLLGPLQQWLRENFDDKESRQPPAPPARRRAVLPSGPWDGSPRPIDGIPGPTTRPIATMPSSAREVAGGRKR